MTDPVVQWNITDPVHLTFNAPTGFQLGSLTQISLIDQAQLTFPSHWNPLQTRLTLRLLQVHWQNNSGAILDATLNSGATFTLANGSQGSIALVDIWGKIQLKPTKAMELSVDFKLDGAISRSAPSPIHVDTVMAGFKFAF
jgi:hypothetical protein